MMEKRRYKKLSLSDGREWIFWQYNDTNVMKSYNKKRFIAVSTFNSAGEFYNMFAGGMEFGIQFKIKNFEKSCCLNILI